VRHEHVVEDTMLRIPVEQHDLHLAEGIERALRQVHLIQAAQQLGLHVPTDGHHGRHAGELGTHADVPLH
jgi:hypothetical protein